MNIIIKKNILIYKGYKLKCSVCKSGTTKSKKEGDLATPVGLFNRITLLGKEEGIGIPLIRISSKTSFLSTFIITFFD